jgi:hypothetical protein
MPDDKRNPEQDPAEGSRETVERQLGERSEERGGPKPDLPQGGSHRGDSNAQTSGH